ncbi:MAG: LacI family DNA-binding transcriptional regulator [Oscillospiraceae bacterium]|nr:LacI family DNA-binding transcriptional regulator [Oscillospiraceae bacterium]MBR6656753.1 LacI family DNA-binding transcriptional regulator [Oscillospiraceae bacterium]
MTIKDLAQKTGYGVATISRVLNNHPNVSEKARKAIMKAVEESGFELNDNAKQLKQQRSNSVLVVVKGTSNEMFGSLVEYIQSEIAKTEYPLLVDYIDEDDNEVLRAVRLCREKKPLGILILGGNMEHFAKDFDKIEVPCVLVSSDASNLNFKNLSSVSTDDRSAAKCAMDSLIELGHRRFAFVGGDRNTSDTGRLRYLGCLDSCIEHGIDFDKNKDYIGVRFSYQDGYDATCLLIKNKRNFTALFAAADVMAIGAMRALRDNGLRVPEDVSVIGFDGLTLGSFLVPKLSTVEQSVRKMAVRSVEILLDCIENGGEAKHETIPFTVRLKESTRKI